MKYAITWKRKRHGTLAEYEAGQRRIIEQMRDWRRPEGVIIHQFVLRDGETGGYAIIETEEIDVVHEATAAFSGFNFQIDRVLDIDAALAPHGIAVEWRDAVV